MSGVTPYGYVCTRADDMGVDAEVLRGPCKYRRLVDVRRVIARELRDPPWSLSYPEIGRALNRDHSSVIYLVRGGRRKQP